MDITFNIKMTMKDRWVSTFLGFLRELEWMGEQGHSSVIGFYADGDGDFRPKFQADIKCRKLAKGYPTKYIPEKLFDAG